MKMDSKLVSYKQYWEPGYIAKKFHCTVVTVRNVMVQLGKPGKPSRDRGKIYAHLRALGYSTEASLTIEK
jgi:hypothetical protein